MESKCIPAKGKLGAHGYGVAYSFGRQTTAHRAVMECTVGAKIPSSLDVCHSCDNRACINADHLWIGTRLENVQDMIKKGRGQIYNRCILTDEQVGEIKRHPYPLGAGKALARRFKVSQQLISAVRAGSRYARVQV